MDRSHHGPVSSVFAMQIWANYEEKPVEEVVHVSEEKERVANYRAVYVTEISDSLHFYTQDVETGNIRVCFVPTVHEWQLLIEENI